MALGLVAAIASGCRRESDHSKGQATNEPNPNAPNAPQGKRSIGGGPTEMGKMTPAGAAASIAGARCDREVRCNKVGPNESYKSRGECVAKMQADESHSMSGTSCPGGINEGNLNRCLKAIHEEECGHPLDVLSRLESCKTDAICIK
jgi:hypothetical protein